MNIREQHKRDINLYIEYREIKSALMRHISTAVQSKCIDFLKNEDTDLIEDDIHTAPSYLFSDYDKVPIRIIKKEHGVLTTPFTRT